MNTVSRNVRLTHLENQDLIRRASEMNLPVTDYARVKLAEPDLSPRVRGILEQHARAVGMTPFELTESILIDYFTEREADVILDGHEAAGMYLDPLLFIKCSSEEKWGMMLHDKVKSKQLEAMNNGHDFGDRTDLPFVTPRQHERNNAAAKADIDRMVKDYPELADEIENLKNTKMKFSREEPEATAPEAVANAQQAPKAKKPRSKKS